MIRRVRAAHPGFLFVAEAYWDLEWQLQQLGFDHCYDKRLYDRLLHESPDAVRGHLHADMAYQRGLIRFLENHDEPRAAASLRRRRSAPRRSPSRRCPAPRCGTRASSRELHVRLPVFLDRDRTSRRIRRCATSTGTAARHRRLRVAHG